MGTELLILIIVLIVVLFWRGPSMLPRLGEAAGHAVKSLRRGMHDLVDGGEGESDASDEPGTRTQP